MCVLLSISLLTFFVVCALLFVRSERRPRVASRFLIDCFGLSIDSTEIASQNSVRILTSFARAFCDVVLFSWLIAAIPTDD